jgi:hypothetical protein
MKVGRIKKARSQLKGEDSRSCTNDKRLMIDGQTMGHAKTLISGEMVHKRMLANSTTR